MTLDDLRNTLAAGFDASATVRVRRPGLIFQVELPAYLADGDAATIFVRPEGPEGQLTVTDLGNTVMRLSYTRTVSPAATDRLEKLARSHGFTFASGQFFRHVPAADLFPAALALAQLEAEAEFAVKAPAPKGITPERFREIVLDAIRSEFKETEVDYVDERSDPQHLYPVDAVIRRRHPVAVAVVPLEIHAERAVSSKLWLAQHDGSLADAKWLALPRNMNALQRGTQGRLVAHYDVPMSRVEDGDFAVRALRQSVN